MSKFTFQPKINPSTQIILENNDQYQKTFLERIENFVSKKLQKSQQLFSQQNEEFMQKHSFKPKISNNYVFDSSSKDFLERQNIFQEKKELLQKIKENEDFENKCTFQPEINFNSRAIVQNKQDQLIDPEDHIKKLYEIPMIKKKVLQEQVKLQKESEFTFQPKINKISKVLAKSKTIQELTNTTKRYQSLQKKKELKLKQEMIECTFKPQTNNNYNKVSSYYQLDKIQNSVNFLSEQKNIKKAILQKEREFEQIKECTFQPDLKKKYIAYDTTLQNVSGIENYLDKVIQSKMLKLQEQEIQDKLFKPEQRYDYKKHEKPTKQQPFRLSHVIQKETIQIHLIER